MRRRMGSDVTPFKQPIALGDKSSVIVISQEFGKHGFAKTSWPQKQRNRRPAFFVNLQKTGFIDEDIAVINDLPEIRHCNREFLYLRHNRFPQHILNRF